MGCGGVAISQCELCPKLLALPLNYISTLHVPVLCYNVHYSQFEVCSNRALHRAEMHALPNEWRETEGSIFEAHTLRRFNVIQHPLRARCGHPCSNLRRRCSIPGPERTKPHPKRWRCNYLSLREKIIHLEHLISQLQQGIQHCTMPPLSTRMLR